MDHRITVCTSCRHTGTTCRPGYELIARLRKAIAAAGDAVPETFEVSGTACMTGCDRPCTVAYHATQTATYLFGDVDPDADIDELVAFARHTGDLQGGAGALGRIPAAVIAIEPSQVRPA